ncbi:MAG: SecY interacting protein Syd [Glaciecola sp.]|jgi:SecY interacting protein Syd
MSTQIVDSLDSFINAYIDLASDDKRELQTDFDADWPSPCLLATDDELALLADGDSTTWRPHLQAASTHLGDLAKALEINIHPDLETLFCRYYSHDLPAVTDRGELDILQAWNEDDFERLQKNLISHVLMKRRLKQAETLFFATTDQEDFIIVMDVASGKVMLEQVGKVPKEVLADDLPSFIQTLRPREVVLTF